jgi:hypothetical protein
MNLDAWGQKTISVFCHVIFFTCFQMGKISAVLAAYIPNELVSIIEWWLCDVLQDVTVDDIRVRRPLPKLLRYGSPPEIRYQSCSFYLSL